MQQHVEQNVQHLCRPGRVGIGGQRLRIVAGVRPGGIGVEGTAQSVDFLGNLSGGPTAGALEQHMFGEVGDALFRRRFIPGPRLHPNVHRGRHRLFFREKQDPQAIVPCVLFHRLFTPFWSGRYMR